MRACLPLLLLLFLFVTGHAQQKTVKGKVTDEQNVPLSGVSVVLKGTTRGAAAGEDGTFTIGVADVQNAVLLVSYTGFKMQEVPLKGRTVLSIVLQTDSTGLKDVIVVGALGLTRKANSVSYSSQTVDVNKLTEARDVNIINGLAGKVAGIQVVSTGQIGSSSRVILRGDNSITGNSQPLWVVDGVPIANNSGELQVAGNLNMDLGNGAADLNPDDIESIEVLKGPNAAALYGSQAANGAILVTTKKAKQGDKTLGISLNQNLMWYRVLEFPDVQNVYGEGSNMNIGTANNIVPGTGAINMGTYGMSWGPPMLGQPYNTYDGRPHGYTPQPGNIQNFYKTSLTNVSSVAVSKADQVSAFRASYTLTRNDDVLLNQNMGLKHAFNLTASRRVSKWLNLESRLAYTYQDWKNRTVTNPAATASLSPTTAYLYLPRSVDFNGLSPYIDANGNEIRRGNISSDNYDNPLWLLYQNPNQDVRKRYIGGVTGTINLLPNLRLRAQITGDQTFLSQYQYTEMGGRISQTGSYSNRTQNDENWATEALFMYTRRFGTKWSVTANLGGNYTSFMSQGRTASIAALLVHDMPSISNSSTAPVASEMLIRRRTQSVYGNANIGYNDLLYLDVTGRNDWSSTLPTNSWSFFYPSVGGTFVFSHLIKKKQTTLTNGKLRVSWAKVGNAASPYQLTNIYSYGGLFLGVPYLNYTNTLTNARLKPEQVVSREIGLDLSLFKDRISIAATAYKTNSTNQILNAAVSEETGYNARVINAGEMQNKGLELTMNAAILKKRKVSLNLIVNWSTNKNEVLSLVPGVDKLTYGQTVGIYNNAIVGQPFGVFTGSRPYRVGDTVLMNGNKNGRVLTESPIIVGSPRPDWIGSVGTSLKVGSFDLSVLANIKVGGLIYCVSGRAGFYGNTLASLDGRDDYFFSSFILGENAQEMLGVGQTVGTTVKSYRDSVRVKGKRWYENAYYPKVDPATGTNVVDKNGRFVPGEKATGWFNPQGIAADYVSGNVDLNIYDASVIKISEIVLGYTVPAGFLQHNSGGVIKSARLSLVGRNLLYLHKNVPRGVDPDAGLNASASGYGVQAAGFFPYAQYGIDLKLNF
jgi:TonB-linked SusC/RagA family outer membrane protein